MEPKRLFDIYVNNINKAFLGSSESTVLKIYLTNDEVDDIYKAVDGKYGKRWICIHGRALLKTSEIKRIVRFMKMNPKIKINGIGVMTVYPNPNQSKQSKSEWLEQLIDGVAECSGMARGEVAECILEVAEL